VVLVVDWVVVVEVVVVFGDFGELFVGDFVFLGDVV